MSYMKVAVINVLSDFSRTLGKLSEALRMTKHSRGTTSGKFNWNSRQIDKKKKLYLNSTGIPLGTFSLVKLFLRLNKMFCPVWLD